MQMNKDIHFMQEAYKEARRAFDEAEVPIGAVLVCKNKIVARAYNQVERLKDATAHAEILAITGASATLQSKYLKECTLYLTLEPCGMCAGAMFWSQLGKLVYGADDPKRGYTILNPGMLHPKTEVQKGLMAEECGKIIKDFFALRR